MNKKKIKTKTYEGQPGATVELSADELERVSGGIVSTGADITISLERLDRDLHNQSYGLIAASTGCASNPGGPAC